MNGMKGIISRLRRLEDMRAPSDEERAMIAAIWEARRKNLEAQGLEFRRTEEQIARAKSYVELWDEEIERRRTPRRRRR